jgi:hypothetical protein
MSQKTELFITTAVRSSNPTLKRKRYFGDLDVSERVPLRWILRKQVARSRVQKWAVVNAVIKLQARYVQKDGSTAERLAPSSGADTRSSCQNFSDLHGIRGFSTVPTKPILSHSLLSLTLL